MSSHDLFPHCIGLPSPPPLLHADGEQYMARRLASNVALKIKNVPVLGSPVMDELRWPGKKDVLTAVPSLVTAVTIQIMISIPFILSRTRHAACSGK
jgi:hypothetical protein